MVARWPVSTVERCPSTTRTPPAKQRRHGTEWRELMQSRVARGAAVKDVEVPLNVN